MSHQPDELSRIERDAIFEAWRSLVAGLMTEPMPAATLATYFDVDPRTMGRLLATMAAKQDAQRARRLWRVRVACMPPSYFIENGLELRAA